MAEDQTPEDEVAMMSDLYRLRIDLCDCDHCDLIRSVLVPVEPDRERIANRIALEYLPDTGPCAFCDSEAGARHRVADAIVDEVLAFVGIGGDE
jgi:hypothetical protein